MVLIQDHKQEKEKQAAEEISLMRDRVLKVDQESRSALADLSEKLKSAQVRLQVFSSGSAVHVSCIDHCLSSLTPVHG